MSCPNKKHSDYEHYVELEKLVGDTNAYNWFRTNQTLPESSAQVQAIAKRFDEHERYIKSLGTKDGVTTIKERLGFERKDKKATPEGYVSETDKDLLAKRVTEKLREERIKTGRGFTQDSDPFITLKGTTVHTYLEKIGEQLANNKKPAWKAVEKMVKDELKDHPEYQELLSSRKDVGLSFFELSSGQFNMLTEAMNSMISEIKETQRLINSKGEATFFFEQPLYDNVNNEAGTADLVVIYSDGSGAIYDFKTKVGKIKEMGSGAIDTYTLQLGNYQSMLKHNYGVTKIRQSRIVPIFVEYGKASTEKIAEGFQKMAAYTKETDHEFLKPIPIEERTGDESLDLLLDRLSNRRKDLISKRETVKNQTERIRISREIKTLDKIVQDLLINNDVEVTIQNLRNIAKKYKDRIALHPTHDDAISDAELNTAIEEMDIFSDLPVQLQDLVSRHPDSKKVQAQLDTANRFIAALRDDLKTELMARHGGERIISIGQGISNLGSFFHGIDNWHIPIFQRLNEILRMAEDRALNDSLKKIKKLEKLDKAFSEWAKNNGYGNKNKFFLLMDQKTKTLHDKYQNEFMEKFNTITSKARKPKWHKDYVELTQDEKNWLKEYFDINVEKVEQYKKDLIENLNYELKANLISQEVYDERIKTFEEYTDPRTSDNIFYRGNVGAFGKDKGFIVPNEKANRFISKEYEFIQNNKPVKEYYDYFNEVVGEYRDEFGQSVIGKNFVPIIHKEFADLFSNNGLMGFKDTFKAAHQKFKLREQDETVGVRNSKGERVKAIPLLYVESLTVDLKDQKDRFVQQVRNDARVAFKEGSEAFEAEVQRRLKAEEYERGRELQSDDLTRSLAMFIGAANDFRHKSAIEPMVQGLLVLINSENFKNTMMDSKQKKAFSKLRNDFVKTSGMEPDMIKAFNRFVDRLIYGKEFDKEVFGMEKYSSNKIIKGMMNFFSATAIMGNLILGASNFGTAIVNSKMVSKEDRHYSKKDLNEALNLFKRQDPKFMNVYEYFQPTTRDVLREKADSLSMNVKGRFFRTQTGYWFHIKGDEFVDVAISNAMSARYVIDSDGRIKNPKWDNIIDENAKSVQESIVYNEENNTYEIPGLDPSEHSKFRDKLRKQAQRIKGMVHERQRGQLYSTMLGYMFQHLRSWMPGMAVNRFGRLEYDTTLESIEEGRMRVMLGSIIGDGFIPALKESSKLIAEVALMGLYSREVNQSKIDSSYKEFLNQIKDDQQLFEKFNSESGKKHFVEMKKGKMQAALSELRTYTALLAALALLGGFKWDDEEEGNIMSWNGYQVARRLLLETSFWLSPTAAGDIIRSPLPLYSLIRRLTLLSENAVVQSYYVVSGKEDERSQKYPFYYTIKTIPILNQFLNFMRIFDPPSQRKNLLDKTIFLED